MNRAFVVILAFHFIVFPLTDQDEEGVSEETPGPSAVAEESNVRSSRPEKTPRVKVENAPKRRSESVLAPPKLTPEGKFYLQV